jgi:hypothetical protein
MGSWRRKIRPPDWWIAELDHHPAVKPEVNFLVLAFSQ